MARSIISSEIWSRNQYNESMSRKSNTEQRRNEITAGLLIAMAAHGYEKATIQSIGAAAGLAPGLIHYHFKSKKDILLHLVRTLAEAGRARFLALAEGACTPDERLRAYVDARLALGDGAAPDAVAAWVAIGAEAVRQPEVRVIYQDVVGDELATVTELARAALLAAGKSPRDAETLAQTLITFGEGAFQLASAAHGVLPSGYAAAAAHAIVDRYIASQTEVGNT